MLTIAIGTPFMDGNRCRRCNSTDRQSETERCLPNCACDTDLTAGGRTEGKRDQLRHDICAVARMSWRRSIPILSDCVVRQGAASARARVVFALALLAATLPTSARAQIDPMRRDLVEFGYDQPLAGHAPVSAYLFYDFSRPQFGDAEHALRLTVSPVYLDGEWDIRGVLGPDTDVGIDVNGGGFAYDYDELGGGRWLRDQSFTGHGGGAGVSVYHLFNPDARIPLNGILRGAFRYVAYLRDSHNPPAFALPENQPIASVRAGLRFGGVEPVLRPDLAAEVSGWYEGQVRFDPGTYGFAGDRNVQSTVHLFWARALLVYTTPKSGQRLSLHVIGGTTVHPDRFSAYRIGGTFTLASEFPLVLPGYYEGELSARRFVLVGAAYAIPLDAGQHWQLGFGASSARIAYTPGFEQPRAWNSGVSAELDYAPTTKSWKASLVYGHALDAVRSGHRGADSVSMLMQVDLEKMGYVASE